MVVIMRVITGKARGMRLLAPEGSDTRPTSDRVKEAMFSIIQFEIDGARVLDLYSGTGQLGIEALSRGAGFCVFIEQSRASVELIKTNLGKTGLAQQARVAVMDSLSFLKSTQERFDIILLDPPYATVALDAVLKLAAERLNETGVLICETARKTATPEAVGAFTVKSEHRYGIASLSVYRRPNEE
ncbi:MAG: 16S rRNA (guanine(966)-N(2))-methyltransferase RsmD [Acetanaerobacterium sp.]